MARPQKEGIDYFSVDCQFNDKVKLIQAEFGLIGVGCLIRLWQKIYGEKGFYTDWNDDVALVFAQDCKSSANVVKEVVSACIRRGIFDRGMYDQYHILTSEGIQERYAEATVRRTSQKIDDRYLLIAMPSNWVNSYNNRVNVDNNSINVDDSTQSKEEEIKEDSFNHSFAREAQEYDDMEDVEYDPAYEDPDTRRDKLYRRRIGNKAVLLSDEQISDLLDQMNTEELDRYIDIIDKCERSGKHYTSKTHYQAILEMAEKDRRIRKRRKGK